MKLTNEEINNHIILIKKKKQKQKPYYNYYGDLNNVLGVEGICRDNSIVFWEKENDVLRTYFYSCDLLELRFLLEMVPKGAIVDYITKNPSDAEVIFDKTKFNNISVMYRMSYVHMTEEEKGEIERRKKLICRNFNSPQNIFIASASEVEKISSLLYEVFDKRESHLPNMEQLKELISQGQVVLYKENKEILGIYIFEIINGRQYGYQIWSGMGPKGYYSMILYADKLFEKYVKERNIIPNSVSPRFGWVNAKNTVAIQLAESFGRKFDGLYDLIYEKQ